MKALGVAPSGLRLARFVSQQIYYSLQAREAEYELIPLAIDQGLGVLVWSPLAGGLLSGKYRRGQQAPAGSRHAHRLGRAAGVRQRRPVRHDRGAGRDRRAAGVSAAQVALGLHPRHSQRSPRW